MNAAVPLPENPFVGPTPIQEHATLFARDFERQDLVDMLIAERFVLLFGPTGVGKTSLINAGVIADFREQGVDCLPVVKLEAKQVADGVNPFIASLFSQLFPATTPDEPLPAELTNALLRKFGEFEGGRVLVIVDTLEQLFTHSSSTGPDVAEFLRVLEILHCGHRGLLLLISMREEFIGRLEGLARPVRPGARLRLGALRGDRAQEAIGQTAALRGVRLPAAHLVSIVRQLAGFDDVRAAPGKASGPEVATDARLQDLSVEPVYLQLTCYKNWPKLVDTAARAQRAEAPPPDDKISVGDTIDEYVEAVIKETLAAHPGLNARRLRTFLAEKMVAPSGELDSVRPDEARAFGIGTDVVETLERKKLVRREPRNGRDEFELSHYLIANAVTRGFHKWGDANLHDFQRNAQTYARQADATLLLSMRQMLALRGWLAAHEDLIDDRDRHFLAASKKAFVHRFSSLRSVVTTTALVILLLGIFGVSRLYKHSEEMHVYINELGDTQKDLDVLRNDMADRARISARLAELGDLDAARKEARRGIADYADFAAPPPELADPGLSMSVPTKFFYWLAPRLSYRRVAEQGEKARSMGEDLAATRATVNSREAVADVVTNRFVIELANQFAPESLVRFKAMLQFVRPEPMVVGASSPNGNLFAFASSRGQVLLLDPRNSGPIPVGFEVLTKYPSLNVTGIFFTGTNPARPDLLIRSNLRDFVKYRIGKDGGWEHSGFVRAEEAAEDDVLDSAIVPNSADEAMCLVSVPESAGSIALMAGPVRGGLMCARRVAITNAPGTSGNPIARGADFLRVSVNGKWVFVGGGAGPGTLLVQDPQTARFLAVPLPDTPRDVIAAAFSADEGRLALAERTGRISMYRLPQPSSVMPQLELPQTVGSRSGQATALTFIAGKWLAAATAGHDLQLIDLESGRVEGSLPGFVAPPMFVTATATDYPYVAAGAPDGTLLFWSAGELHMESRAIDFTSTLEDYCKRKSCGRYDARRVPGASAVALDSKLGAIAIGLEDGRTLMLEEDEEDVVVFPAPDEAQGAVTRVAWSPDSKLLALAYQRGLIRLVKLETGVPFVIASQPRLTGLGFLDDRTLLSAGLDQRRGYFKVASDRGSVTDARFFPAVAPPEERDAQWRSLAIDPVSGTIVVTREAGAVVFEPAQWTRDEIPPDLAKQFLLTHASDRIVSAHRFGSLVAEGGVNGIQRLHALEGTTPRTEVIGGRRDRILRQYWDNTGTLLFAFDGNGTLRITDAVHMRPVLSIDLPITRDTDAEGVRRRPSQDMHVVCKSADAIDPTKQECAVVTTLGAGQPRVALLKLDMF